MGRPWPRFWLLLNVLSLDAPIIAVLWQRLFAQSVHVSLHPAAVIALFLTVWLIYILDRLLDARAGKQTGSTRHQFHSRYARLLITVAACALPVLAVAVSDLRPAVLHSGLWLGTIVAAYFCVVHAFPPRFQKLFPKELAVGAVFAAGACLAPWARTVNGRLLLVPAILFGLVCAINCAAIEAREATADGTHWLSGHLPAACALVATMALASGHREPSLAIAISAVLLAALLLARRHFSNDAFRVLADVPLLTPLVWIIPR